MKPAIPLSCACPVVQRDPALEREAIRDWWRIGFGALVAGYSMTLSLAINSSEVSPSTRSAANWGLFAAALVLWLILGGPLLRRALQSARSRRVTVEALFLVGLLGASSVSVQGMISGSSPVYFETVAILLVVYAFGRRLTQSSQERALAAVESWLGLPETCERVGSDSSISECTVAQVEPGDLVRVHPGRLIPVDGLVDSGPAFIQESHLTGESLVRRVQAGDLVGAGSVCVDATLLIRATAHGNARRIDRIARAVEQARACPSRLVTEADRIARLFLPVILVVASLTFIAWTLAADWRTGLLSSLSVLLVACPCALGFATPVTVWSAIGRIADRGLVARAGTFIEELAAADVVVFDKTGTLTSTRPALTDLVFDDASPDQHALWRQLIVAAEQASDHPLAAAFSCLAHSSSPITVGWVEARPIPGAGVAADVSWTRDGYTASGHLCIGSERILSTDQADHWRNLAARLHAANDARRLAVTLDGVPVAAAAVDEQPVDTLQAALRILDELGLRRMVMTGDSLERAARVGVPEVEARLTPERKQERVKDLRAAGAHVLFVGDGLNDAAAMAEADASITMAGAAPLARETADAMMVDQDLTAIPIAIEIARRAVRVIRGNMRIALFYNALGMSIAAAGWLHPVSAAILMTCSSLIVSWRSLSSMHEEPSVVPIRTDCQEARDAAFSS